MWSADDSGLHGPEPSRDPAEEGEGEPAEEGEPARGLSWLPDRDPDWLSLQFELAMRSQNFTVRQRNKQVLIELMIVMRRRVDMPR